jgi:Na+/H+ antiporter NhaD/arsenite permease-like protein
MKKLKQISFHLIILLLLIIPVFLHADGEIPTGPTTPNGGTSVIGEIGNPIGDAAGNDLLSFINAIFENILMPIASVAVVMYIIYAGFTFVTAQGKPKEVDEAKQRLLWALVGAGILLGATGISYVIRNTVNSLITP